MRLDPLLEQAVGAPVLFIPRVESHWFGMTLGVASTALGIAVGQFEPADREAWSWVALGGVLVGMWLHWRWKKADTGWRVDFSRRRVDPVGLVGEASHIDGAGWSIQVAPGDHKTSVAVDLRHEDRGRVARLLDAPATRKPDRTALSALADTLARRLDIARTGLTL